MVGVVRDASSGGLAEIVEDNLRAWLPLLGFLEGARFEKRNGYVWWTSATRLPFFNGVLGAPAADNAGPEIDDPLAPFDEGDTARSSQRSTAFRRRPAHCSRRPG